MTNTPEAIEDVLKALTLLYTIEIRVENIADLRVLVEEHEDKETLETYDVITLGLNGNNFVEPLRMDDAEVQSDFDMKAEEFACFLCEYGAERGC